MVLETLCSCISFSVPSSGRCLINADVDAQAPHSRGCVCFSVHLSGYPLDYTARTSGKCKAHPAAQLLCLGPWKSGPLWSQSATSYMERLVPYLQPLIFPLTHMPACTSRLPVPCLQLLSSDKCLGACSASPGLYHAQSAHAPHYQAEDQPLMDAGALL